MVHKVPQLYLLFSLSSASLKLSFVQVQIFVVFDSYRTLAWFVRRTSCRIESLVSSVICRSFLIKAPLCFTLLSSFRSSESSAGCQWLYLKICMDRLSIAKRAKSPMACYGAENIFSIVFTEDKEDNVGRLPFSPFDNWARHAWSLWS